VRRGAVRVASQSKSAEVRHAGFANPDGSMVLVITNPGSPGTVQLQLGGAVSEAALPADSVTTLTWKS